MVDVLVPAVAQKANGTADKSKKKDTSPKVKTGSLINDCKKAASNVID